MPAEPKSDGDPRVSVVIPAYNAEVYVRATLDSVLAQTFTDYEIIVVNDASTDSTPDILREYERDGRICVVEHDVNRGLAAARNSGIRRARGEFVTFVDADDLWRAEKLEYQMRVLQAHPEVNFVSNSSLWFRDGETPDFPPLPEEPELRPVDWQSLVLGASPFSASNAIVRADCLREVGLFDERLRAAEDRDLWIRLARRFGTVRLEGLVSAYRRHGGNMSSDPDHMKRNMVIVLDKTFRRVAAPFPLRRRAYAQMHLDVAVTCYEARRRMGAVGSLVRSFLAWPLPLGRTVTTVPLVRLIWLGKMILGRSLFEGIWGLTRRVRGAGKGREAAKKRSEVAN